MKKLPIKNQQGMSLMETVFALAILVIGILSVLTMTGSSIILSQASEQNIVVVNLAREGLELVRGVRESSIRSTAEVLPAGVDDFFAVADGCYLVGPDAANFKLTSMSAVDCNDLANCTNCQLSLYNGVYTHNPLGTVTLFRRLVKFESISGTEKRITSRVSWQERGRQHQFILEDYLTEWQ